MSPTDAGLGEFLRTITELSMRLAGMASAFAEERAEHERLKAKYDALHKAHALTQKNTSAS